MNPPLLSAPSVTARAANVDASRRRSERRVAHRVPCRVRAPHAEHGQALVVLGQTVNLSANGLAVQLGCPMPPGTSVEILLPHLDGEPTRLMGQVVHNRRVLTGTFEMGISVEPEFAAD